MSQTFSPQKNFKAQYQISKFVSTVKVFSRFSKVSNRVRCKIFLLPFFHRSSPPPASEAQTSLISLNSKTIQPWLYMELKIKMINFLFSLQQQFFSRPKRRMCCEMVKLGERKNTERNFFLLLLHFFSAERKRSKLESYIKINDNLFRRFAPFLSLLHSLSGECFKFRSI